MICRAWIFVGVTMNRNAQIYVLLNMRNTSRSEDGETYKSLRRVQTTDDGQPSPTCLMSALLQLAFGQV